MSKEKELPKWFDGLVYKEGDFVRNPFSGEGCELTAIQLSMYDLILGAQFVNDVKLLRKGLDWFRSANPSAYMILLD